MEKEMQDKSTVTSFSSRSSSRVQRHGIYLSKFPKRRWCLSDVISIVDVFHTRLLMKAATVVVENRDILASVQQHGRTGAPCCSSGSWNHLIGSYAPYYIASNKDTKVLIMFFFSLFFPVAQDQRKGKKIVNWPGVDDGCPRLCVCSKKHWNKNLNNIVAIIHSKCCLVSFFFFLNKILGAPRAEFTVP